jgi:hypothetical protein
MRSVTCKLLAHAAAFSCLTLVARADSVWINGAGLRAVSTTQALSGQVFSTGESGGSMLMHAGDASSNLSLALPASIGMPITFRIEYSPSLGYRFSIGNASQSHSLVWGLAPSIDAGPLADDGVNDPTTTGAGIDGGTTSSRSTELLSGKTAFSQSFNTLSFNASIASQAASLEVSDLRFDSYGSLDVASGELASASSLYSGGASSVFSQSIFSDVDLAGRNWSMSGSLWTSMAGPVTIEIDQSQSQFTVIPLPPAAAAGMATLAGIAGVSVLRRRRQA